MGGGSSFAPMLRPTARRRQAGQTRPGKADDCHCSSEHVLADVAYTEDLTSYEGGDHRQTDRVGCSVGPRELDTLTGAAMWSEVLLDGRCMFFLLLLPLQPPLHEAGWEWKRSEDDAEIPGLFDNGIFLYKRGLSKYPRRTDDKANCHALVSREYAIDMHSSCKCGKETSAEGP